MKVSTVFCTGYNTYLPHFKNLQLTFMLGIEPEYHLGLKPISKKPIDQKTEKKRTKRASKVEANKDEDSDSDD